MFLDEDRVQRRVKVLSIPNARRLDRRERIEHRARPDRNASFTQSAGEVDDVLRQDAAACRFGLYQRAHFGLARSHSDPISSRRSSARVSSISVCAFAPSIFAISS